MLRETQTQQSMQETLDFLEIASGTNVRSSQKVVMLILFTILYELKKK